MTEQELIMSEEQNYKQFNPCVYCRKTLKCVIECEAKCGFNSIMTAKHNDCITRNYTEKDWLKKLSDNAGKYGFSSLLDSMPNLGKNDEETKLEG